MKKRKNNTSAKQNFPKENKKRNLKKNAYDCNKIFKPKKCKQLISNQNFF